MRKFFFSVFLFYAACQMEAAIQKEDYEKTLKEAHSLFKSNKEGKPITYTDDVPAIDLDKFGIAIVTTAGDLYQIGDASQTFALQSICKPLLFALALHDHGRDALIKKVGVEPTGMPFNSILSIKLRYPHLQNPSVNAGAIASASLIKGSSPEEKFDRILQLVSSLTYHPPSVDSQILTSERKQNATNMSIAYLLKSLNIIYDNPEQSVDIYLKACSINTTAIDLAHIGAALANWGKSPKNHQQILEIKEVRDILSVMLTSGMYDFSGEWMFRVGLPAKSGVGGGILIVVPGVCGIGLYSPLLNEEGNSQKGVLASEYLSKRLRLHLFDPRDPKQNWIPEEEYTEKNAK